MSITMTRFKIPTCTAAKPMPGAEYMVTSISSNNLLSSSSTFSRLSLFFLKIGSGSITIFLLEIINYISNCPCTHLFPCMEMFSVIQFIANSAIKKSLAYQFIKLITHKLYTRIDNNLNQQFLYACLDIFNYKFNNYNKNSKIIKFAPKLVLKIKFSHKIIELINLNKCIHSKPFIDLLPFPP